MSKINLKSKFPRAYPCPICGELVSVFKTKKNKPYFTCEPCGIQVFIRGKTGISEFSEINSHILMNKKSSVISVFCELILFRIKNELIRLGKIKEKEKIKQDSLIDACNKAEITENIRDFFREIQKLIPKIEKLGISLSNENEEG